jgi:hypothetical protein
VYDFDTKSLNRQLNRVLDVLSGGDKQATSEPTDMLIPSRCKPAYGYFYQPIKETQFFTLEEERRHIDCLPASIVMGTTADVLI